MDVIKSTTHYIPLLPNPAYRENNLCVEVGYQVGGQNWRNGATELRGYYLYCCPVIREDRVDGNGVPYFTTQTVLGAGYKHLLKEVTRRSQKAEAEAIRLAEIQERWLIEQVCARYGLRLAKGKTISFISPIRARMDTDDYLEASSETAMDYAGPISEFLQAVIPDEESYDKAVGILRWADEPMLRMYMRSIVESSIGLTIGRNGQPVMEYRFECMPHLLPATVKELSEAIASELESQYSDGWGESVNQMPLHTDDGDLYIQVWEPGFSFEEIRID